MAKRKRTFMDIFHDINKAHGYDNEYEIDYFSGDDRREPKQYDDYYATTRFGACEGIYTDFFVMREEDGAKEHIATAKTLNEDNASFIKMHELAAKAILELRRIQTINHNAL